MSLMELLFDREDPLLKESLKDEVLMEENYGEDHIAVSFYLFFFFFML